MIQSLYIRNIALIEEMEIPFEDGLLVLTGETGAGKSIIVDAVNLVLGGRADKDLIRTGTERASVEATFEIHDDAKVQAFLDREQLDCSETVSLYREITRSGRSVCRVQGTPVTLAALKEIAQYLMDVHGQHEAQFLMNPAFHLQFLDESGDASHQALLAQTKAACEAFLDSHHRYRKLQQENEKKVYRVETLKKELSELTKAQLTPGEEEALKKEQEKLHASGRILHAVRTAYGNISVGDEDAILPKLKISLDALKSIAGLDPAYENLGSRVENAYYELQEVGFELSTLLDSGAFDPNRAEKVDTRLELIRRLEKKYGPDIHTILEKQQAMQEEYDRFESMDDKLASLLKENRQRLAVYRECAHKLTENRKQLAHAFEENICKELRDLGMEKTRFAVDFAEVPEKQLPQAHGDDQVSFLISANPGEPLKPLSKIASGGELSRIMLALKSLEANRGGVGTMVFDEIDTGISGRMAQVVAEKMCKIARSHQVLCVTHLPQIAAMADHALLVEKHDVDGITRTNVHTLSQEERVSEVARMLLGADGEGDSARAHAKHMLDAADSFRETLT